MIQYNILNVKRFNSQLNKLKSGIKNGTEVTLKIYSNVAGDYNDENSFLHKLLLTNTQVPNLRKASANNSSANIKLSKTQLHKIGQSGGFLGRLLGPLLKTGLPLMKNVLKPLAKSILIPLGSTVVVSATDVAIHKVWIRISYGSGMTTLIISNEKMNNIMKIVQSLEESGLFIKRLRETIKNEVKEQKRGFVIMLLGTLGAGLLENLRISKDTIRASEDTIRSGQDF